MAQDPNSQYVTCRTCGAGRGEPCKTRYGKVAAKVHWGRPHYSERKTYVPRPPRPAAPPVVPWYQRVDPEDVAEYERRRYGD